MKTLAFLTLFLGLVMGRPTVELAAVDGTQVVELRMDGELQARIEGGPPWKAPLELGEELAPHRLEAVGYDAEGRVTGRAEQWLNLPRALAEVQLFLELPSSGGRGTADVVRGATVRVVWTAARHSRAREVAVSFDGEPLPADDLEAIPLPPFDAEGLHVLSAVVTFPDDTTARGDLAYGPYGDEVTTELTGVAVEVEEPGSLRRAAGAGDLLQARGEALPVVAVDHGAVDLFAVLDAGSELHRQALTVAMARRMGHRGARLSGFTDRETGETTFRATGIRGPVESPLREVGMKSGDRLHLVRPQLRERDDDLRLFAISPALANDAGGSAWQLALLSVRHDPGRPQQLSDAVAAVGLWATSRSRPRAVVLVIGPQAEDESVLQPAAAGRYLARLGVPLAVVYVEVETPAARTPQGRAARLAAARSRWGADVVDVADVGDWIRFHRELRQRLERQRVLWVPGRHLPQDVELSESAAPVTLVGRDGGP